MPCISHAVRPEDASLIGRVRRLECDGGSAPAQSFQGRLLVVHQSHDDIAAIRRRLSSDDDGVAIEDAGFDHRVAANFQSEMFTGSQEVGRHGDAVALRLDGGDRRTGRDSSHHRDGIRPRDGSLRDLGLRPLGTPTTRHQGRREGSRPRLLQRGLLGKSQDFQSAGAIGQPANEATLFERHDEPVNARLRFEIERILHLVERWWHSVTLEAGMDETEQLALLFGQHDHAPRNGRPDRPTQTKHERNVAVPRAFRKPTFNQALSFAKRIIRQRVPTSAAGA